MIETLEVKLLMCDVVLTNASIMSEVYPGQLLKNNEHGNFYTAICRDSCEKTPEKQAKHVQSRGYSAHHLCLVSKRQLQVGDYCMYYDLPSKVIEIQCVDLPYEKRTAIIETLAPLSENDRQFLNEIQRKKGKPDVGFEGVMKHGFSVEQLSKIEATTDHGLGLQFYISIDFIKKYVACSGQITSVYLNMVTGFTQQCNDSPSIEYQQPKRLIGNEVVILNKDDELLSKDCV